MVTMFIDDQTYERDGRTYRRVLLRQSYWENDRSKSRTIANLSKCSEQELHAIKLALKHKGDLAALASVSDDLSLRQGPSVGATYLLTEIAHRLGIQKALGRSRDAKLATWQVCARVMDRGSRLSAVRLASTRPVAEALGLKKSFNEQDLYDNLEWLSIRQRKIEQRLLNGRRKNSLPTLFLYDVTSSYLEGQKNELAAFGYNRDGKKGKRQIVIGLLCDDEGYPVSVDVFRGNTSDLATFTTQIRKVADDFRCEHVTFVGDRGMIKSTQIEELGEEQFSYISALTKPQIESRLKKGIFQLGLFEKTIAEVETDAERYVLRRNPVRAAEMAAKREDKKDSIQRRVAKQNTYLAEHPRAQVPVARRKIRNRIKKLRLDGWLEVKADERTLSLAMDEEALAEQSKLDGCYCIRSDIPSKRADAQTIHDRYKDLEEVERTFRTCKTGLLDMRPIFVRTEASTRGHVFVVMLAYLITQYLEEAWRDLDITVREGLRELDTLCATEIEIDGESRCYTIPEPRDLCKKLLERAKVTLPDVLPKYDIRIVTKKKLPSRRKNA